jgi:transcriptional regulator with XRE-family HTH domain
MGGLGDVLTVVRRSRGLTQAELAESAGLTQAALSRYESGLREPDGDVLDRLGRALGVTTRFLTDAGRVRGGMRPSS